MALKNVYFLFLLLLTGWLGSCQTPSNNSLHTSTAVLSDWHYCWPEPVNADAQTPESLAKLRLQQCDQKWLPASIPLNPEGRGSGKQRKQWLWLKVNLPMLEAGDHIYMRGIDEEFVVYDTLGEIYRFGDLNTTSRWHEGFPWHMISVGKQHSRKPLYFLVHSKYRHIGIFGSVRLGSKASHLYNMLFTDLDRVIVGGLLIFTGIMVFLLFLNQPVVGYQWLCLFSVTIGIYLIVRTEIKQLYWYAPVVMKWVEIGCLYTAVPSVTFFLSRIFAEDKTMLWSRLIQLQTAVSLGGLLLASCRIISIQETTQPFLLLTLINMVLGLGIVLWRFRDFGGSGWFAVVGVGCLSLFTGYDILAALKIVPWVRPVTHWGVLLVLISLVFLVKKQVDNTYNEKNRIEESSRVKTLFLTNFSHELRTPLSAIIGFSDLLKKNHQPEKVSEYSQIISHSGKSLLGTINAILDLGKIESNRLELEVNTLKFSRLIQQLQQMFSLEAQQKNLEWECHVSSGVPDMMRLDEGKFRQVLINLLGNAFKFTEQGAVTISFDYEAEGTHGQGLLRVSVKDTGIGIQPEQLEKVFEPFYQVEQSLQRRFSGTGLGLSISQRLIIFMGGDLEVSSTLGLGSHFNFWLPVEAVSIALEDDIAPSEKSDGASSQPTDSASDSFSKLPEEVQQKLKKELEGVLQQKSIQRIQQYADLLIQTGQQYAENGLQSTGVDLVDAASQFDIARINTLLNYLERAYRSSY